LCCHCEETQRRSNPDVTLAPLLARDCVASLAMTIAEEEA
jgi:hypothetical protein